MERMAPNPIRSSVSRVGLAIALIGPMIVCSGIIPDGFAAAKFGGMAVIFGIFLMFGSLCFPKMVPAQSFMKCGACGAEWPMP